ncbi:MAG: hypothetical protein ACFHVJ_06340 [Aestuariibacter sp.]
MSILRRSDEEILEAANHILDTKHEAARQQDWAKYSKYMLPEHITPEHQEEVEKQWHEQEVLRTLTNKRELLGIFRQENRVLVSWKQWSTATEDELLAVLWLTEHNSDIKACGNRIF